MDTNNGSKPPATTAGAEAAAMQTQILEAGTKQDELVVGTIEKNEHGTTTIEKKPDNGLKNYFVTAPLLELPLSANFGTTASLFLRDQAGCHAHSTMLYDLHWFGHRDAVDECGLRFVNGCH
jgi:hypothetical protein